MLRESEVFVYYFVVLRYIIINNIYYNPSLPPLKFNPNILRKLLLK